MDADHAGTVAGNDIATMARCRASRADIALARSEAADR